MSETPEECLARVVTVKSLSNIPGADRIELARVLDWNVIVKKGDFEVNDVAIYISINSILPADKESTKFLLGKPLKTKKMRGCISQGLLLSLKDVAEFGITELKLDDDLTAALGITKNIPQEERGEYARVTDPALAFPSQARKTAEARIQNCGKDLECLAGKRVVVSQKLDGTSTTFATIAGEFIVCGRNFRVQDIPGNSHYFKVVHDLSLAEKMLALGRDIAIQGETVGPKINCNRMKLDSVEFCVFNIFDITAQCYLEHEEVLKVTSALSLKTVPIVHYGIIPEDLLSVKALLDLADSQRYAKGDVAEGIVVKSDTDLNVVRYSMKVISNEYLIKHKL